MNRLPGFRDPWAPSVRDEAEFGIFSEIVSGVASIFSGDKKEKEKKREEPPAPPPPAFPGAQFVPWAFGAATFLTLALILGRPK